MIDVPLTVVRAVHFAAVLGLEGAIAFRFIVSAPVLEAFVTDRLLANRSRWIAVTLWGVAVVSGGAWLAMLAGQIGGTTVVDALRQGVDWTLLTETQFGISWLCRAVIAGLLGFTLLFGRGRSRGHSAAAVALGLALTGSLAWSGHGAATPGRIGDLHLVADILHLTASGLWVGALLPFAITLRLAGRGGMSPQGASEITRRFSNLATSSVAVILLSGIINSWVLVGSISGLTTGPYGRLLLAKVGLFAVMLAIAAFNRVVLTPLLTRDVSRTARRLAVNSFLELALGMAVLAIVAVLGTLQPASHHHATATESIPDDAAFVHIHGAEAMADILIEPGRVGRADVTIRVLRDDLSELPARSVDVALVPPPGATDPETREAVHQPDTSWQVKGVDLSAAGNWTVKVLVSLPSSRNPLVLDAPILIESRR